MIRFSMHAFSIRVYFYTYACLILDFLLISWFSFMFLVNACTWMPESHHLIMYTFACLCMPLRTHLTACWVASDNPGLACLDLGAWTVMDVLLIRVAQQKCVDQRFLARALFFQAPGSAFEFLCYSSWAPFVLFILVYFIAIHTLCLLVM